MSGAFPSTQPGRRARWASWRPSDAHEALWLWPHSVHHLTFQKPPTAEAVNSLQSRTIPQKAPEETTDPTRGRGTFPYLGLSIDGGSCCSQRGGGPPPHLQPSPGRQQDRRGCAQPRAPLEELLGGRHVPVHPLQASPGREEDRLLLLAPDLHTLGFRV